MRCRFVAAEKADYPLTLLCRTMKVSRSGFYGWIGSARSERDRADQKLLPIVREIFLQSGATYGSRRMARALQARAVACSRSRARRLMLLAGLSVRRTSKWKATTNSRHSLPVSPNLLLRDFAAAEPNRAWVGDITYIWTSEGWLYVAVILDLFSRRVVGWAMGKRITSKLVTTALRMALWRRRPENELVFHSDRGSQYTSFDFQQLLDANGLTGSMSRKGDPYDNAVVESFFASLKSDRVFRSHYKNREEARRAIVDYIEMFYNSSRLHSSLGYVSPREFEEMWLAGEAS